MPCFEVRRSTMVLANVNPQFLQWGLEKLGLTVEARTDGTLVYRDQRARSGTFKHGTLVYDQGLTTNQGLLTDALLKPAIAGAVVEHAAKKFGWQTQAQGQRTYVLQKRG